MLEDKNDICPVCGTPLVDATIDGSFALDGSVPLSGKKCLKCSGQKQEDICPVCGTPLVDLKFDGTATFGEDAVFGGKHCPKCSPKE